MPFNDSSTGTGVVQEINDITNADNNSYPLTSKARRVNQALDRFFTIAFRSAKEQSFGDLNDTTAPVESLNLVSGTQSYAIDAFTSDILRVLRVEAINSAGLGYELVPLDRTKVLGALTEYASTDGTPAEYDFVGDKIFLYPAPNYNSTNGLTFYFNRGKSTFLSTDTTKELGVPNLFYKYICNHAALPYLIENGKAHKNDIAVLIEKDERAIEDYFSYFRPRKKPDQIIHT